MKFEKFFFPLIVIAAIASVYAALKSGKTLPQVIQQNAPLPPSLSSIASPAQSGTFTQQAQQSVPWYISYNFTELPGQLPINNLTSSGSGCGTCSGTQYV